MLIYYSDACGECLCDYIYVVPSVSMKKHIITQNSSFGKIPPSISSSDQPHHRRASAAADLAPRRLRKSSYGYGSSGNILTGKLTLEKFLFRFFTITSY